MTVSTRRPPLASPLGHAVEARGSGRSVRMVECTRLDGVLLVSALALISLGLVMVTSASVALADKQGNPFYYALRQCGFVLLGMLVGYLALWKVELGWIERHRYWWALLALLVLALVLLPGIGHTVNGSRRWIGLGLISVQASEIARLLLIFYLAAYLVAKRDMVMNSWRGFFNPMVVLVLASGLLLIEPDLGAAVVLVATGMTMIFMAGGKMRWMIISIMLAVLALSLLIWFEPYRMRRLTGFSDPWADPLDEGFQLSMALIAIGRGGWEGVGLGESVQKLFYLPAAHTDFIFSVLAEELGLPGMLAVIGLFVIFLQRGYAIGKLAERRGQLFGAYLAYGLTTWIGLQAFISMGVNMGLLPTKGLTLPFISYGGSSMVVMCVASALLLRVYHEATANHAMREAT